MSVEGAGDVPRHDCHLRLDHAEAHIEKLEALVEAFLNGDPWTAEVDHEEGGAASVRLVGPPVPSTIALTAGDAINALRACLDNLAWQLVEAQAAPPHDRTSWPVVRVGDSMSDRMGSAKLRGLPTDCKDLMRSMQPASGLEWQWMAALDRLWNDDKHRHLLLTAGFAFPPSGHVALAPGTSSGGFAAQHNKTLRVGRVALGEVLFRLPPGFDDARLRVEVGVAFAEHAPADQTAPYFLRRCLDQLRGTVLPAFRPFLPGL